MMKKIKKGKKSIVLKTDSHDTGKIDLKKDDEDEELALGVKMFKNMVRK